MSNSRIEKNAVGPIIQEAMDRQNLTLMAVQERTRRNDPTGKGVSFEGVRKIASGLVTPSEKTLAKLAEALNLPLAKLIAVSKESYIRQHYGTKGIRLMEAGPQSEVEQLYKRLTPSQQNTVLIFMKALLPAPALTDSMGRRRGRAAS